VVQNLAMLIVGTVVLGVTDLQRALDFWMNALHYVWREEPEDDWAVLVPAEGRHGTHLALGLSQTPAQKYPRVHLDLYAQDAADQASEVERLVALGAERIDWDLYPDDPDFVVLSDPEGNRFCVVDKSHG
jgi:catechol 2,3-dioxygenase-like lactoylglutathione lyase family enzyme